jgi:hypothetical protein
VEELRESGEGSEAGEGDRSARDSGDRKPERGGGAPRGLEGYTSVIVKKNLFLQLGSGGEKRGPQYALTAVVMPSMPEESNSRAIIEQRGGGASYYVVEGDTFAGGIEVTEIEDDAVKLDNSGEEIRLSLGEGTSGGGGGGGRGGGRRGGGRNPGGGSNEGRRSRGGGEDFDPGEIPPFARRMLEERGISIEELRNNPELRNRLRGEFEARFRDGGGGGPQMLRAGGGRGRGRRNRNR